MSDVTIYEVWWSESTYSATVTGRESFLANLSLLEDDAVLTHTIEAVSWNDAMTKYHELMGFEPYQPMEDDEHDC